MAAFYLHEPDEQFEQSNLFYVRFMDDILILAPTRWKIRKAMALVQATLLRLHLDTHPDKTFIGRIVRGFDFLGYLFRDGVLSAAGKTVAKMKESAARLYEQKGRRNQPTPLGQYLTRWNAWFRGVLVDLNLCFPLLPHPQCRKTSETRC